jgi:monoamine oxidase
MLPVKSVGCQISVMNYVYPLLNYVIIYRMRGKKTRIVIVGAGIAGLAAAKALIAHGFEVNVLEARDRYGGRIWVDQSLGTPIGRGATWIHGLHNNPVMPLARQFPSQYVSTSDFKGYTFDRHGKLIPNERVAHFESTLEKIIHRAETFAWTQEHDISLAEAFSAVLNPQEWAALDQDLLLRKLKFFENYMGADYARLSARHWDEDENISGGTAFLVDAYATIIAGLAADCPIQYHAEVHLIREHSHGLEIRTSQGAYTADAAIVTLPLGVLKKQRVTFEPALSLQKQGAIDRLGMGLFNIIAMVFPDFFWPPDGYAFFLPSSPVCAAFFNAGAFIKKPVLLGYTGGITARSLECSADEILMATIIKELRHIFPQAGAPEKYFITRWGQDPFSYGSYSSLPPGATPEDRDLLAQPESNRLFFAGEASCKEFPATVQGAYLSGLREADRIIKIMG